MKILPFKIPKPENNTLIFQEDVEFVFFDKLHQHEEIQVSFIEQGEGTLIVGDTVNNYKKGDILIFGSNLPHVFKSELNTTIKSNMISLFFTKDAFGSCFFDLEEMKELRSFFKKAENGSKISTKNPKIRNLFLNLKMATKLEQFILFLEILKILSRAKHQSLSSFIYERKYTDNEGKRMRDVMEYTMNNYYQNISLNDIASVAAMTKNAFCKYFKKRTNKTYFTFLNELRVENACKLILIGNDLSMAQIATNSGFTNISNFNRKFKSVKHFSPTDFRKNNKF